jgi:hypothetical protein
MTEEERVSDLINFGLTAEQAAAVVAASDILTDDDEE